MVVVHQITFHWLTALIVTLSEAVSQSESTADLLCAFILKRSLSCVEVRALPVLASADLSLYVQRQLTAHALFILQIHYF